MGKLPNGISGKKTTVYAYAHDGIALSFGPRMRCNRGANFRLYGTRLREALW
jgi:hypothetical protein